LGTDREKRRKGACNESENIRMEAERPKEKDWEEMVKKEKD